MTSEPLYKDLHPISWPPSVQEQIDRLYFVVNHFQLKNTGCIEWYPSWLSLTAPAWPEYPAWARLLWIRPDPPECRLPNESSDLLRERLEVDFHLWLIQEVWKKRISFDPNVRFGRFGSLHYQATSHAVLRYPRWVLVTQQNGRMGSPELRTGITLTEFLPLLWLFPEYFLSIDATYGDPFFILSSTWARDQASRVEDRELCLGIVVEKEGGLRFVSVRGDRKCITSSVGMLTLACS